MHRILFVTSLLLGAVASGQKPQEALRAKRAAKLAKPFVRQANWQLDYAAARATAKREGKWLLAYFTRSYAP